MDDGISTHTPPIPKSPSASPTILPGAWAPALSVERRVLEALALDEFKQGHLTKPELRRLLGFGTAHEAR